eukprot:9483736-Pyramimonas_sp.AAC.1
MRSIRGPRLLFPPVAFGTPFRPPWADIAVARSVAKLEAVVRPEAQMALRAEWGRLRAIETRGGNGYQAYNDVVNWPNGKAAHFGRLFASFIEENSELPEDHEGRAFKGRVVLAGSD